MKKVCFVVLISTIITNCCCDVNFDLSEEEEQDLELYNAEVDRLFSMIKRATKTGQPPMHPDESYTAKRSQTEDSWLGELHHFEIDSSISKSESSNDSENASPKDNDRQPDSLDIPMSLTTTRYQSSAESYTTRQYQFETFPSRIAHPLRQRILTEKPPVARTETGCLGDLDHVHEMFKQCINPHSELSTMINKNHTSSIDHVNKFLKYCQRAPLARTCIKTYVFEKMDSCLDEGVRDTINSVESITRQIIRFMCRNEGDRIMLFIEDGGIDCLKSTKVLVTGCLTYHLGTMFLSSMFYMPFSQLRDECGNIRAAQKCVYGQFGSCPDKTLADAVWMIFDVAKEITSCPVLKQESTVLQLLDVSESTVLQLTNVSKSSVLELLDTSERPESRPFRSDDGGRDQVEDTMTDGENDDTMARSLPTHSAIPDNSKGLTSSLFLSTGLPTDPTESTQQHDDENDSKLNRNSSANNIVMLCTIILSVLLTLNL